MLTGTPSSHMMIGIEFSFASWAVELQPKRRDRISVADKGGLFRRFSGPAGQPMPSQQARDRRATRPTAPDQPGMPSGSSSGIWSTKAVRT